MPANEDRVDPDESERFRWIPFTAAYWLVGGIASLLYSNWWVLLAAWLATPLAIVIGYCVFLAVQNVKKKRPTAASADEVALPDQRRDDRNAA